MSNGSGPQLYVVRGDDKRSSVNEALELFLCKFDNARTRKSYEAEIRRLFRWLGHEDIRSVTPADLLRYRARKAELAAATRHRILVSIRQFFSFAAKHGFVDPDPAADLELPRVHPVEPEILSQAEAELLLRVPDRRTFKGRRDALILSLALCNGLRVSELCGLNVGDQKERYGRPALRVRGKGRKERILVLSEREIDALHGYLSVRRGADGATSPLLTTVRGTPRRITRKVVAGALESARRRALIDKPLTPHTLRHTCFSLELANGADIYKISRQAAHSSLAVTSRYIHQLHGCTEPAVEKNPLGHFSRNSGMAAD